MGSRTARAWLRNTMLDASSLSRKQRTVGCAGLAPSKIADMTSTRQYTRTRRAYLSPSRPWLLPPRIRSLAAGRKPMRLTVGLSGHQRTRRMRVATVASTVTKIVAECVATKEVSAHMGSRTARAWLRNTMLDASSLSRKQRTVGCAGLAPSKIADMTSTRQYTRTRRAYLSHTRICAAGRSSMRLIVGLNLMRVATMASTAMASPLLASSVAPNLVS